jgi:hypothetical protein
MIVSDDSRVINELETSLTDNARVVIYDRHMFKVQATGYTVSADKSGAYPSETPFRCSFLGQAPGLTHKV